MALAGAAAMVDTALGAVSAARAAALVRPARGNGEAGGRRQESPPWGAAALEQVAADKVRHRQLLLLLRAAGELSAATLVALVTVAAFGPGWTAALVTAGAMTLVSFAVVGVGARTLGRYHAYPVARLAAPALGGLAGVLAPLAWALGRLGRAVPLRRGWRDAPFATPENGEQDVTVELRELVDLAEESGAVEQGERQMIHSVFRLGDTVAREVMVPRTEMVWIEAHKSLRQGLALALRSGFSRVPVIGASVDEVLGVVYLKDLARRTVGGNGALAETVRVDQVMRRALFVPASKPVDDLLSEMRAARVHLAIVVDEYGGTAGLVTIEDILEEIVGEITDEYDVESPPVQRLADGSARVSARLPIEDLAELFGVELAAHEVGTVAGLLAQALGRVPIPGAAATVGGLRLVAEGASGRRNRIATVLVRQVDADRREAAERRPADLHG